MQVSFQVDQKVQRINACEYSPRRRAITRINNMELPFSDAKLENALFLKEGVS